MSDERRRDESHHESRHSHRHHSDDDAVGHDRHSSHKSHKHKKKHKHSSHRDHSPKRAKRDSADVDLDELERTRKELLAQLDSDKPRSRSRSRSPRHRRSRSPSSSHRRRSRSPSSSHHRRRDDRSRSPRRHRSPERQRSRSPSRHSHRDRRRSRSPRRDASRRRSPERRDRYDRDNRRGRGERDASHRRRSRSPRRYNDRDGRDRGDRDSHRNGHSRHHDDKTDRHDKEKQQALEPAAKETAVAQDDTIDLSGVSLIVEEQDEQAEIERARKRREAILAKARAKSKATAVANNPSVATPASDRTDTQTPLLGNESTAYSRTETPSRRPNSPPNDEDDDFDIDLGLTDAPAGGFDAEADEAIDDALLDEALREQENEIKQRLLDRQRQHSNGDAEANGNDKADTTDKNDKEEDEEPDMFSENFKVEATVDTGAVATARDGYDDHEGYYRLQMGEVMDGRYKVFGFTGQGVFSNVVRAKDVTNKDQLVAIKILRNNDVMLKSGLKELEVLNKLKSLDVHGRHHTVHILRSFRHRQHLCLVFEHLSMNLREVQRKYGRNKGLNLKAVQSYTHQLLLSLRLLRKAHMIHADIKPDNMVVNDRNNVVKLCDFGSAFGEDEVEVTPFLVSRFYRAPEIMLGMPYSYPIDVWALATTLFETFTGRILFQGASNNEMLKLVFELKGHPSQKWLKKGQFKDEHFADDGKFKFEEVDKITQKVKISMLSLAKPSKDLKSLLLRNHKLTADEEVHFNNFKDLLEKMLMVDPDKRISAKDALKHPFIVTKM